MAEIENKLDLRAIEIHIDGSGHGWTDKQIDGHGSIDSDSTVDADSEYI